MSIILVVDDEAEIVYIIGRFLKENGFGVIECVTGKEAVEVIRSDAYFNLVVLDLKMPQIDGSKILEELKKTGKDVPVILITGSIDEKVTELKTDLLLRKPIDLKDLLAAIKELL